jgi:hypothetical protein
MRVEVDAKTYFVEWQHHPGHALSREGTTCLIRDGNSPSPGDGTFPVVATGDARLHPNDTFCKETGRKVALKRALLSFEQTMRPGEGNSSTAKAIRRAFWDAYHSRPGGRAIFPPEVALAAVHNWLMDAVLREEADLDRTGAGETDWCALIRRLGPILADAARGRLHPDVLSKNAAVAE